MARKRERLRLRLQQELETAKPAVIDEPLARRMREGVGAVSDRMWRDLLRECGIPLAPLVEGIRQDNLHELERTLLEMGQEYRQARTVGDEGLQQRCRKAVIAAKDHARLASRNEKLSESKRREKDEGILWMLTWLENPGIFELWVGLRKSQITATRGFGPG